MSAIDHLLTLSKTYAEAENVEPSTVSWRVFGDTKKLGAIAAGADIQVKRAERAMRWFSQNWPQNVEWPSDIARPDAEASAA